MGRGRQTPRGPSSPRRPYRQLLGVRGESPHVPDGLRPPQDEGQAGPLARDAGDVHALQGVQVDLPDLDGRGQPAVPARGGAWAGSARTRHGPGPGGLPSPCTTAPPERRLRWDCSFGPTSTPSRAPRVNEDVGLSQSAPWASVTPNQASGKPMGGTMRQRTWARVKQAWAWEPRTGCLGPRTPALHCTMGRCAPHGSG